jgi:hypothetical protein
VTSIPATSYRDLAALLRELASTGSVTVETRFDDRPALAAVTTVGLDGTFVVSVDPALLEAPELWERHRRAVEARLLPLTEPRAWFARIAALASWIAALTVVASAITAVLSTDRPMKQLLIVVVPATLAALLRYFIRPLAARILGRLVARSLTDGAP